MSVLDFITTEPQTKRVLAEKLNTTPREIELLVNEARQNGVPIVSDSDGYRYATTAAEARECADRLRSRAVRQLLTARALRRAASRMEQRVTLW